MLYAVKVTQGKTRAQVCQSAWCWLLGHLQAAVAAAACLRQLGDGVTTCTHALEALTSVVHNMWPIEAALSIRAVDALHLLTVHVQPLQSAIDKACQLQCFSVRAFLHNPSLLQYETQTDMNRHAVA